MFGDWHYLLLNMFNGQGDEPNVIISEEMNDVLQSNIDLKRPRLCYAKNAKCNPSIPEETTVECDFCNMVSPEIKFKKGSSDYNAANFDEPISKMVRLLKQDEQVILKIVGRGDLIDGRHRRGHIDNKYNFNSNDDGEHRDPPPIHNDLISGVQRDEFDGNENLNLIELNGIGDLGQKRAMAIRNKMIEME